MEARNKARTLVTRGLLALLTLLLLGAASCGRREPGPPNILLVTLDTTRSDHLSLYGYTFPTSPFLEELAAAGTVFDECYAAAPATAPSHATLFTSRSPLNHRVVKNAVRLAERHETLAEMLRDRGYATAAVLSSFVMNAKFGLGQGFGHYDDMLSLRGSSIRWKEWEGQTVTGGFDRRAGAATDRAVAWLEDERDPDAPFFLFVHYFDPHDPYDPPTAYRERFDNPSIDHPGVRTMLKHYDGEIAYTDDELRRLVAALDRLGLADDTLVIVTGDHGEGLMQRGYQYHGAHIYEEAVRVPLLVRWPGHVLAGRRHAGPVTIADVVPTIHELCGWPLAGRGFQGRSLAASLRDGTPPPADGPVFLYRIPYEPHSEFGVWVDGEKHGVRAGSWKYLVSENEGTRELYDLARDPGETRNVADEQPERVRELAGMLADWRAAVTVPDSLTEEPVLSDEDVQKLKSLGYIH
jgi:arylsulfatase A-like enzyme